MYADLHPYGKRSEREGMTLLLVVVLLAAFLSIAAGIFQIAFTEYRLSGELSDSFRALYAADEGIERLFFYDRVLDSALGCSGLGACTGIPETIFFGNGACMKLELSRDATAQTVVTAVGEFRCGGSPIAVRRALWATYQKEAVADQLIALWPLDEGGGAQTAVDVRGGNNMVLGDTTAAEATDPAWTTVSGTDGALKFNGSTILKSLMNDFAQAPNDYSGTGPTPAIFDNFTIAFWGYPLENRTSTAELTSGLAFGWNLNLQSFALFPSDGGTGCISPSRKGAGVSVGQNGVSVFERDSTCAVYPPLVYNTTINSWTHIAVVYQSRTPMLYINGVLERTGLTPTGQVFPPRQLGDNGPNYGDFKGCIDDVRIYDQSLDAAMILDDYNATQAVHAGASC